MTFELEQRPCDVRHCNVRGENHGPDEQVLAQDLDVSVTMPLRQLPSCFADITEGLFLAMFYPNGLPRISGLAEANFGRIEGDVAVQLDVDAETYEFFVEGVRKIKVHKPVSSGVVTLAFQLQHRPTSPEAAGLISHAVVADCKIAVRDLNGQLEV